MPHADHGQPHLTPPVRPEKSRRLKLSVGLAIGFIVWIPARLQIHETWMRINNIWDHVEKCLSLLIDLAPDAYFMWLAKAKLLANGLTRYRRVYRFNLAMVCISIATDVGFPWTLQKWRRNPKLANVVDETKS